MTMSNTRGKPSKATVSNKNAAAPSEKAEVVIPHGVLRLHANLDQPQQAQGVIIFAHGSGSSRFSSRNIRVAETLRDAGFATLLMDLLTAHEEAVDDQTSALRFDVTTLAERVLSAIDWVAAAPTLKDLPIGLFGASTGAAAALIAASLRPEAVRAVVSRGGRPDLAGAALATVRAPTLLIVGGLDDVVIDLNRQALALLPATKKLVLVPGAGHLFEEPGQLAQVSDFASAWFAKYLAR